MAILPFGVRGKSRDAGSSDRAASILDHRIRAAFDSAPVGLAVAALDGRWLLFNETCCSLLGYKRDELVHYSLNDITHPEDAHKELTLIRRLVTGEAQRYRMEKRTMDKSGHYRVHDVTAVLVHGSGNEPDVFVYALESPQPKVETGFDADRLAAAILQSLTGTAVIRMDATGTITGWNAGAEQMLGFKRDEIIGRNRRHLFRDQDTWEDRPIVNLKLAREHGVYECTDWRVRRDGSHLWLKSVVIPFSPDGTVRGYVETLSPPESDSIDMSSALERLRVELREERATTVSLQERLEQMNERVATRTREIQLLATELRAEVERRKAAELQLKESCEQAQPEPDPVAVPGEEAPAEPWLQPAVAIGVDEPLPTQWVLLEGHAPIRLVIDTARSLRTGALIVACGQAHKAMFFREGRLCCVASDSTSHHLGERLVSEGLISEAQREEALEFSERTDLAFGRSLIALGFLTYDQVTDGIRAKIETEIEEFASWSECQWVFVEREPPHIKLIQLALDVRELRAVRAAVAAAAAPAEEQEESSRTRQIRKPRYVVLADSAQFHTPDCAIVTESAASPAVEVHSKREARRKGLEPCGRCQ